MKNSSLALIRKCDALSSSKFLFSSRYITDLLRLIALDKEIFAISHDCMKGFDCKAEYNAAVIETGSRETIRLPSNNRRIVALVLYILYGFDNDNTTILPFLERFYPAANPNASFETMSKSLIEPFKDALVDIIENGADISADYGEPDEQIVTVPDGAVHSIDNLVRNIHAKLASATDLEPAVKNDFAAIADGLYFAMTTKDVKLIKIVYLGFKYSLYFYRPLAREVKDVEASLKLFLII